MEQLIVAVKFDSPGDIRRVNRPGMLDVLETIPQQAKEGIDIEKSKGFHHVILIKLLL